MKISLLEYFLELKKPFGISGNSRTATPVVFVKIEHDGSLGFGEASLPPYLPETTSSVLSFISSLNFDSLSDYSYLKLLDHLHSFEGNNTAKAAIEIALLDLFAKLSGKTAASFLNLNSSTPLNTYTIGIGELSDIKEKLNDASDFNVIKVKLGSDYDKEIINEIRKHTSAALCIDVNQGWKTKEHAIEMIDWLAQQNVILIEQPLLKNDLESHYWLHQRSQLPIYADESFQNISDLVNVKECFSGINIKLMKCGGPSKALEIIAAAKKQSLKILLGSMNESSCANMAAAHISSEADFTDLDGPFLIKNNPFKDPEMKDGRIILPETPGLGLELSDGFCNFQERFSYGSNCYL